MRKLTQRVAKLNTNDEAYKLLAEEFPDMFPKLLERPSDFEIGRRPEWYDFVDSPLCLLLNSQQNDEFEEAKRNWENDNEQYRAAKELNKETDEYNAHLIKRAREKFPHYYGAACKVLKEEINFKLNEMIASLCFRMQLTKLQEANA